MLKQIWWRLVRLFQRWFGRKQPTAPVRREPPPELTDTDLEYMFTQLLAGVQQQRGQNWALKYLQNIENRVTTERWVEWLQRFGARLLASPARNNELAARMVQLGDLDIGEVGNLAYEIGMQLFARNPGEPIWDYDGADAQPIKTEDDAEAWRDQGNEQSEAGDFLGAIASFDQAIAIKPDYHEAYSDKGVALDKLGQSEEAIASYNRATEIKSDKHEA
jgi:tetratricopeptide (TPR) repeat protein